MFLDPQLRVGNFTPPMTDIYHLRASDRGRPLTEIAARIDYPQLRSDASQVLRSLVVTERVVQDISSGASYLLRMRPYRTVDNVIDGVVLTFVDISERQQAEVARARLSAIVDSSREIIIGHDLDGIISSWNASAEVILGYREASVRGKSIALLMPGHGDQAPDVLLQACAQNRAASELEMQWLHRDGQLVPVAVTCSPVLNADGKAVAGSLIARDIGERQRAAEHQQLLLGELNHRVKNTLASVQAIALKTLSGATDMAHFRDTFLARLHALSNTHNLLAVDAWIGVDLRALVLGELAPYQREDTSSVDVAGDDLQLLPKAALALGMALHELAINAAKYGALSVPQGAVAVRWATHTADGQQKLMLTWTERGGPQVVVPTRRGFGSCLISEGLAFELDGTVTLAFEPDGVTCRIDVPLAEIVKQ